MSGFLAINRKISDRAKEYIRKRNVKEIQAKPKNVGCYIFVLILVVLSLLTTAPIFAFVGIALLFLTKVYQWLLRPWVVEQRLKKNQKLNEEYYQLLRTGILIHADLKSLGSKDVGSRRVRMRYIYELRYFDLQEKVQVFKFFIENKQKDENFANVPVIFDPKNSRRAIFFHVPFLASKIAKKKLFHEPDLIVQPSGEIDLSERQEIKK